MFIFFVSYFLFADESKRFLNCYHTFDKYFFETETYKEAESTFVTNDIVVFTGPPGCGKTMAAIHLIRKKLHDWTFRKIQSWEDLPFINEEEKTIVFIDNIFFRRPVDLDLEKWWDCLNKMHNKYFAFNNDDLGSHRLRIVMTARPNAIEKACVYMGKTTPILYEKYLIDVGCISPDEKEKILDMQIEFAKREKPDSVPKIDTKFKKIVRESEGPIGFPLCAHLFVCSEEYQNSGAIFFSRPIEYLKRQIKDEVTNDRSQRTKTLFFFLFFLEWHSRKSLTKQIEIKNGSECQGFLEEMSKDLLTTFAPFNFDELEREAQRLLGTFFKKVDEQKYRFVHDSVFEAVGTYFCETYVTGTAKFFPLDIIQCQEYVNLTEVETATLATRLLHEILEKQISHVFSCKIMKNEKFVKFICSEMEKKDEKKVELILTIANESSAVKLPCIFWSSCNNLFHLTERLYDIIRKRKFNSDYQLYAFLYGICCARNKGLFKTTNGMFLDNLKLIKERVLGFQDSDGNSILHLIITSRYSDKFSAFAVENILMDGVPVDLRNKHRISPLMVAVEQILPRKQVIKNIVKLSPKLRYKDSNNSTVFHHCLRSNNDDETCADYLQIILSGEDSKDALSKDDINGDTALSIAAKETNRSRIRTMLVLLETGADIIDTLNEDGYSPLHLCVRSLNVEPAYMKLECCIRVITLILYGANPDKKSDKDNKPIDECKVDLIKDILRFPKDETYMENALQSIQEDLKIVQSKEKADEFWISSKKFSAGLRQRITQCADFLNTNCFDHKS